MYARIKEIFERKPVKSFLLIASILGFAVCILAMRTQIIDYIINIVETKILNRDMGDINNINKWKDYLFGSLYSFTVFFVITWYFFIKRNFIASLCYLFSSFGIYLFTYMLFTANRGMHDILRFPLIALLCVIVVHLVVNVRYLAPLYAVFKKTNHYLTESKTINSPLFVFICGGLLGSLFFLYIFGTAILDFTYTDWLMSGGDLSQHYTGWMLFRQSAWHFPIGLMDNIVYPFKISMIYTDSIPLFAIFFKLLSPLLPENFQYFGLFGIICYILQGGCGALIIRKIGGSTLQSIIGSLFFIFSAIMMERLYSHTSLAAHFIILLCILAGLEHKNYNLKKQIVIWSFLIALSVSIHLYFVPMVMVFMFFCLLQKCFLSKNWKSQCAVMGISLLTLIVTMFCLGAFYFVNDLQGGDLRLHGANLNTFINPQGTSRFMQNMPNAAIGQYEGFAYFGMGIILFIIIIIGYNFHNQNKQKLSAITKTGLTPYVSGIMLFFLFFALSPTITFNEYILFTYPVLPSVELLWSIFQSTGRMVWPIIYITITICIWWAVTHISLKKSFIFLCVLLLIQWFDLNTWFVSKGNHFKTKVSWQTELSSPVWNNLADDYNHLFLHGYHIAARTEDEKKLYSFLNLAGNNKMTINDAYLARKNSQKINENRQREEANMMNGIIKDDTIYVFHNKELAYQFRESGMRFFIIDDIIIGISSDKNYLDNYVLHLL